MFTGYRTIAGLTHNQANDGIPITSMPGDPAGPISYFNVFYNAQGLPPLDAAISLEGFPGDFVFPGSNSLGDAGGLASYTNTGDDKHFATSLGTLTLPNGLWGQSFRILVNNILGTRSFSIAFGAYEVSDFNTTLTDSPDNLSASDTSYDPITEEGNTDLTFSYDNSNAENPVAIAVLRDGVFVGSVPWVNGTVDYAYTDTVFAPGDYVYTVAAYKYPDSISPTSAPITVTFSGTSPDINVTMDLSFSLDWLSTVVLIVEPSGIYTLVEGKTHDTLYTHTTPATVDVKIPRPFAKSAFLGD